jgi:transcription elongation factor Elf1
MVDPVDECVGGRKCKWNPRPSEKWRVAVDDAPWQGDSEDKMKILDCPRCGHRISVDSGTVTADTIREIISAVRDQSPAVELERVADRIDSDDKLVSARCNCRLEHEGHPAKPDDFAWGCGQAGAIRAPS